MNKINKYIVIPILLACLLSACGTVTHTRKKSSFEPDKVTLKINISDLNYLGESEVTLSYSKYLGFIYSLEEINGIQYDPTNVKETKIDGVYIPQKYVSKALYKVLDDYPDATYYQLVYNQMEVHKLFMGKELKQTIRIKAYSFK